MAPLSWSQLLKWSIAQLHGSPSSPTRLSEEEQRWIMDALEAQARAAEWATDVIGRLREIALLLRTPIRLLQAHGVTADELEDLLSELQDLVESIDIANDFHSVGGLVPLIDYLRNSEARLRAKAADVVSTVVQNNPMSQQYVMDAHGFSPLLSNFTTDPDLSVRTKSLGAISSLIRNNNPGIAAFRLANGYRGLRDALSSDSARFQRKALNLTAYLLNERASDCSLCTSLGFPRLMMHLASSEDMGVREAALLGLLELVRYNALRTKMILSEHDWLRRLLLQRIESIRRMAPEDLDAAREESQLVDSLWVACYHQPSSLQSEGLLGLPCEDDLQSPPDIASTSEDTVDPGSRGGGGKPLLLGS